MIALIIPQKPKSFPTDSQVTDITSLSSQQPKKRLVAKWLLDENSHLYCQWITEINN